MHFREIFDPLVQMREILRPEQIREISGQCHPHTTHPGTCDVLCGLRLWITETITYEVVKRHVPVMLRRYTVTHGSTRFEMM